MVRGVYGLGLESSPWPDLGHRSWEMWSLSGCPGGEQQPAAAPLSCCLQWLRFKEMLGPLVSAISRRMVGRQVLGTRHHLAYLIRRCNSVAWRQRWEQLKLLLSDLTSAPTCCLLCAPRTHSLQGADEIRTKCTVLQI